MATLGGRASGISQSNSEQTDSPEELLKTLVGAIAIKDRIHGEVFHPDSAIGRKSRGRDDTAAWTHPTNWGERLPARNDGGFGTECGQVLWISAKPTPGAEKLPGFDVFRSLFSP